MAPQQENNKGPIPMEQRMVALELSQRTVLHDVKEIRQALSEAEIAREAIGRKQEELFHSVAANTSITNAIKNDTEDLVYLLRGAKVGATLLIKFMRILKWISGTIVSVAAAYAVYAAIKNGSLAHLPIKLPE